MGTQGRAQPSGGFGARTDSRNVSQNILRDVSRKVWRNLQPNVWRAVLRRALPQAPDIGCETDFLEQADRQIAHVGLPPAPSQPRDTRARMMIAMPVLALAKLHQGKPGHVAAGILAGRNPGLRMANAVDEALGVEREDQANRPHPEKGGGAEIQAAEV